MAEYIDRTKIPWVKTDNSKGKYWDRIVCESTIKNMKQADVVECSEYQKLKEKNTELEITSDDFLRLNEVLKRENSRLHEKIDNAKANIEILLEAEKQKDGTYTDIGKGIAIALGLLNYELKEYHKEE